MEIITTRAGSDSHSSDSLAVEILFSIQKGISLNPARTTDVLNLLENQNLVKE